MRETLYYYVFVVFDYVETPPPRRPRGRAPAALPRFTGPDVWLNTQSSRSLIAGVMSLLHRLIDIRTRKTTKTRESSAVGTTDKYVFPFRSVKIVRTRYTRRRRVGE